jgi:Xaa-Pro aminopeptidase
LPATPIFQHPLSFAGETAESKLAKLRRIVNESKAQAYLVSDLSEIAWLYVRHCYALLVSFGASLNLRANDIDGNNPLFYAYAVVSAMGTILFVRSEQLKPEVKAYLSDIKVQIAPYESVRDVLGKTDWGRGQVRLVLYMSPVAHASTDSGISVNARSAFRCVWKCKCDEYIASS